MCGRSFHFFCLPCSTDEDLPCIALSVSIEGGKDPSMVDETSRKAYAMLQRFDKGI